VSVIYRYRSARLDFVPLLLPAERILPKDRKRERQTDTERERERERERKRTIEQDEKETKRRGRIMAAV